MGHTPGKASTASRRKHAKVAQLIHNQSALPPTELVQGLAIASKECSKKRHTPLDMTMVAGASME